VAEGALRRLLAAAALCALSLPAAGSAQLRYLAFGDSITLGVGDDPARAEQGYPPRLEALLAAAGIPAEVENHGVGGERTPQALVRVNSVLNRGGDGFLLMEGSNDISRQISLETTIFNLDEMARRAAARGIRPVHATVIPRIPWATIDPDNKTSDRLNQEIRTLAWAANRRLVDNFEVFGARPDPFGRLYVRDTDDHVGHPNAAGYDVMAAAFADVLRDLDSVPPVVAGLFPADGSRGVPQDSEVLVDVVDFGAGIDLGATSLLVNGAAVQGAPQGDARRAVLGFSPPPGQGWRGVVTVGLRSRDLATSPNGVDRAIGSFIAAGTVLPPGDVDESGRVDGVDMIVLARAFGSSTGDLRFWRPADINGDGSVDGDDLAILAANFGRSS
jgi:lysophospholipase L1-like esterase